MYFLYKIQNNINSTIYIGKSKNPRYRWTAHKCISNSGGEKSYIHHFKYIHAAIRKYGIDNFSFKIIAEFETEQEAYDAETTLIANLKKNGTKLYNLAPGGLGAKSGNLHPGFGKPRSLETKEKISSSKSGQNLGSSNPNFGNVYSSESRAKISDARRGKKHSEKTKNKISQSLLSNQNRNIYQGENHPRAKLSVKDVLKIRGLLAEKVKVSKICEIFDIHKNTVYSIKNGVNWKSLEKDSK